MVVETTPWVLKKHTIFPEIDTDKVDKNSTEWMLLLLTSAETDEEAYALLKHFGMPFQEYITSINMAKKYLDSTKRKKKN